MNSSVQLISPVVRSRTGMKADRPRERAFGSLIRTIGLLDRAMHPYFAGFGISRSQWSALRALYSAESAGLAGLRITELSEQMLIRPPSVTGVLDRLQRRGLVTRDADAEDLRAKCVRLTARGKSLAEEVLLVHGQQIDRLLAGLNVPDCSQLNRLADRLSAHLENLLQQLPAEE